MANQFKSSGNGPQRDNYLCKSLKNAGEFALVVDIPLEWICDVLQGDSLTIQSALMDAGAP